MSANPYGFNVAARPSNNYSQCEYQMREQGKEKYGPYAYGPSGSLINTDEEFTVKTEFVSTENYQDLWKLRTTLRQAGNEMIMEADCEGYLDVFDSDIQGKMSFVFSTWDNTQVQGADFECQDSCPQPANNCDNAQVAFKDIKFDFKGSNENPTDDDDEDEESEEEESEEEESEEDEDDDDIPVPAEFVSFRGFVDEDVEWAEAGDYELYLKGLDGSYLATNDDEIIMHKNNKAFVLDMPYDDSIEWGYYTSYLGASFTFDVNVNNVGCGCAAGVYLAALDDEYCSWDPYPADTTPQCASVDLMEANRNGFITASHPCEFGSCDVESKSKHNLNFDDPFAFGPSGKFKINSKKDFTVKTQFFADKDEDGYYTELEKIVTTLTQGSEEVKIVQDDRDYLYPLSTMLDYQMALGISVYNAGVDNEISNKECNDSCSNPQSVISNLRWVANDAVGAEMIVGEATQRLDDCEEGCTECRHAWNEFTPENVEITCMDKREMKYNRKCPNKGRWNSEKCNAEGYCV